MSPTGDPEYAPPQAELGRGRREQRNSGLGLASFLLAVGGGVLMIVILGISGYMEMNTPGGIDPESAEAIGLGLVMLATFGAHLLGLLLGLLGLFQPHRKRTLAVLGVILNALVLLGVAGLVAYGFSLE